MNNELLIKTCQRLGELEGMENCPYILWSGGVHRGLVGQYNKVVDKNEYIYEAYNRGLSKIEASESLECLLTSTNLEGDSCIFGPYLPIKDLDKWSSAKILARAGYDLDEVLDKITDLIEPLWDTNPDMADKLYTMWGKANDALYSGLIETGAMLLVILLHDADRPAYDKGMAPLLEVK